MVDNISKPAAKKPHPAVFVAVIALVLVALGAALYLTKMPKSSEVTSEEVVTEETTTPEATPQEVVSIDVNAALSDRILGNTSAPVKISEHASFTCSHCGDFHRETFDKIKTEYIDTGKAYFVFSDFPLNAPAIHASMVARCLPQDKYFDFVQMLFKDQKDWAYDSNYLDYLKKKAGEQGLSEASFKACIENTELQNGIVNRMKGIQQQWNINSTPSFVINNRTTISGAYPYEEFKKVIETELAGKKSEAPSGAGMSETGNPEESPIKPEATQESAPAPETAPEEATPAPDAAPAAEEATPAPDAAPAADLTAPPAAPTPAEETPAATPGSEEGAAPAQ